MRKSFLLFAFDFPFPPNRGGRADIWRRIQSLKLLGHRVFLVCWYVQRPSDENERRVREAVDGLALFPIRNKLADLVKRLLYVGRLPSHVVGRILPDKDREKLEANLVGFGVDAVISEGPYPYAEARRFASLLRRPLFYRSHNIEHLYMARQAKASLSFVRKCALAFATIGLKKFETAAMLEADAIFDISVDDIKYWEGFGVEGARWLPPVPQFYFEEFIPKFDPQYDVVFLGNLTTPNNVQGILWYLDQVLPILLKNKPDISVLISGSNPAEVIVSACSQYKMVELLPNPPDALAIYRKGRVLINPVKVGSGINVKSIEMLMLKQPIVTTSQGVAGMTDDIKKFFSVADSSSVFANKILDYLGSSIDRDAPQDLMLLSRRFSPSAVGDALEWAFLKEQSNA